jgi:hypothetical protein
MPHQAQNLPAVPSDDHTHVKYKVVEAASNRVVCLVLLRSQACN